MLAVLWLAVAAARPPAVSRPAPAIVALVTVLVGIVAASRADRPGLRRRRPDVARCDGCVWALVVAVSRCSCYFHLRARALSPAIAEARLQALQARIRPHFLFNSINAVLSLVRSEPQRAEAALQDMADLFRVLMRDNRELAPLADEVELCRQYLELEKLRLGERLMVDWNVKSMPGDALVPPLVLQPLLENAVYHGIEPSSDAGHGVDQHVPVARRSARDPQESRTAPNGGRHHSGNKMALDNMRERLALHFDAEASLESRVTKDGYEVHIRMPYRTTRPEPQVDASGARAERARNPSQCGLNVRAHARAARTARHARKRRWPWLSNALRVLIVDDEAPGAPPAARAARRLRGGAAARRSSARRNTGARRSTCCRPRPPTSC